VTVAILVLVAVVLIGLVVLAAVSIKIVREYQRVVLFRLGRANSARGPGLIIINPITDRISWVDLRERYLEIPHQTAITQDNAAIAIDFIIFYKVLDPLTSVLSVQDFKGAATNIASTTLRSVVGDMTLDDVLSKRDEMNGVLRLKLDDVTERWGVKVTNVEVRVPGWCGVRDSSEVTLRHRKMKSGEGKQGSIAKRWSRRTRTSRQLRLWSSMREKRAVVSGATLKSRNQQTNAEPQLALAA